MLCSDPPLPASKNRTFLCPAFVNLALGHHCRLAWPTCGQNPRGMPVWRGCPPADWPWPRNGVIGTLGDRRFAWAIGSACALQPLDGPTCLLDGGRTGPGSSLPHGADDEGAVQPCTSHGCDISSANPPCSVAPDEETNLEGQSSLQPQADVGLSLSFCRLTSPLEGGSLDSGPPRTLWRVSARPC